ncbi:MAG TPA: tetratricopeptide repeat protein [Rhizomicrobium sp.]|nr:tetratricopeptide repeat protein [Rhizomicrobium sp.]
MGAKKFGVLAAAAVILGFAGTTPTYATTPGFAQVGPGAGDLANNCANNPDSTIEQRLDACTRAVESTAWHGTAWPYYYRAHIYEELRKRDLALADLNDAIKIARIHDPLLPLVYHDRCDMRAENDRDLPGALADCNRSLELRPNDTSTMYSRALVEFELADYAAVLADCSAILAKQPDDASALQLRDLATSKSNAGRTAQSGR